MRSLYPYQEKAVQYIKTTEHPAVFMEMRLGKSLCVIRGLRGLSGRKLIVCPKGAIPPWQDEFETEMITDYSLFTSAEIPKFFWSPNSLWSLPNWIVMNYEAVTRIHPDWLDAYFDHVVLDESVRIKEPRTLTTKFFLHNFRKAKKRLILSGNPAPNTPLEYFCQFKFLDNSWLGCDNYWQFRSRYFSSDMMGYQFWIRATSKEIVKLELQKRAFVLTRKQAGVANKKVYEKRVVDMPSKLKKMYRDMLKEFFVNLPNGDRLETKYILPQIAYLQQLAGGWIKGFKVAEHKIHELKELLQGELKGEPVIVWSRFRKEITHVTNALKKIGIRAEKIDGKVNVLARKKLRDAFQTGKLNCLVMQVRTGKYALNLSRSSTAIYLSNSTSPDDRSQSEYRIEHNEKNEPLLYIDIVSKDTVDEAILKALQKKKKDAYYFLGDVVENLRRTYEMDDSRPGN